MQQDNQEPFTDEELLELENEDTWDWDSAEIHPAVANPHVVVPLRFTQAEFALIAPAARKRGIPLTVFMHDLIMSAMQDDQGHNGVTQSTRPGVSPLSDLDPDSVMSSKDG